MSLPTDPDCYWVEPGLLLAGEYPGAWDEATARTKLGATLRTGIRKGGTPSPEAMEQATYVRDWRAPTRR